MNREFKFRAWHAINRIMLDNKSIPVLCKNMVNDGVWFFMQYIGMKDIKGEETYEGDIVSDGHLKGVVFFNSDEAKFQVDFRPYDHDPQDLSSETCWHEVVGNIHEHPELLK